jgi:hypothetical protein
MQWHIDSMPDASPLKCSVARLQAYNLKKILAIDVPPDDRMALQKNERLRLVLLTSGLVSQQQSRNKACFHSLLPAHIIFQDEAQQNGSMDELVVSSLLDQKGLAIQVGDDAQPALLVDPGNQRMVKWADGLKHRQAGIRGEQIRFAPAEILLANLLVEAMEFNPRKRKEAYRAADGHRSRSIPTRGSFERAAGQRNTNGCGDTRQNETIEHRSISGSQRRRPTAAAIGRYDALPPNYQHPDRGACIPTDNRYH